MTIHHPQQHRLTISQLYLPIAQRTCQTAFPLRNLVSYHRYHLYFYLMMRTFKLQATQLRICTLCPGMIALFTVLLLRVIRHQVLLSIVFPLVLFRTVSPPIIIIHAPCSPPIKYQHFVAPFEVFRGIFATFYLSVVLNASATVMPYNFLLVMIS